MTGSSSIGLVASSSNPAHAASNRPQGFGVQLPDNETCRELRKRVEGLLAGALQSSRPTHTL